MAKKKPHLRNLSTQVPTSGRARKEKGKTQKTSMQRVMVIGANGKTRMEWRPW